MAAFILMQSNPVLLVPWHSLSARVQVNGLSSPPFEAANGADVFSLAMADPCFSKVMNEAMACDARIIVPEVIASCVEAFHGVESIVDVGGGDGTTVSLLVNACPWITRAINFDLPHVVSVAKESDQVENVGGDMFDCIPKADAAILKWVPKDKGKVIILEAVIEEDKLKLEEDDLSDVRMMMDMVMMAHTSAGKERTLKEWQCLLQEAGFAQLKVTHINAAQSVIQAFL